MNDPTSSITPLITLFSLNTQYYVPNNRFGYYFIDNTNHKLFTTTSSSPYITELPAIFDEPIKCGCMIKDIFIYVPIKKPKSIVMRMPDGKKKVADCSEPLIAIDAFKTTIIGISSTYLFLLNLTDGRMQKTKHRALTGWKWIGDYIITISQMRNQIIYETYQVCESFHLIQSVAKPTETDSKLSFDVVRIRDKLYLFSYQANNKVAHLIEIGPQKRNVQDLHIIVNNFAQVSITGDLLLVMTSSIGILYELVDKPKKISLVKLPPLSPNNIRLNQNQFLNFNERTITTLKADFELLIQNLSPTEQTSFLLNHSAPQIVLQNTLLRIFNKFVEKEIDLDTLIEVFKLSSGSNAISSALVDWRPNPQIYSYVMIEFLCSNKTKVPSSVYCRLIEALIDDSQLSRLLMLLQYHIIPDDEIIALQLVQWKDKCDFIYQFAMDMLKRMKKNNEQILDILVSCGNYMDALMFCIEYNIKIPDIHLNKIRDEVKNPVLLYQFNEYILSYQNQSLN